METSRKEKSPICDSLAAEQKGLNQSNLNNRLQRYGTGKSRALLMSDYIKEEHSGNKDYRNLSTKIHNCGSYLVFRNYFEMDEVRLHSAKFCKKHLLCPFCAMRRGAKYLNAYMGKLDIIKRTESDLRAFMVTITIKDRESLSDAFTHLRNNLKRYQEMRRNSLKGQKHCEYAKALGGVFSIEFKRGENSGLWHPHVHMIWLCKETPSSKAISEEWLGLTGDSYIVDVREIYDGLENGFLEVFKYALKFSSMTLEDNFHAYQILNGRRLVDNFGLFRGVQVDDDLTDGVPEEEQPYLTMVYQYYRSVGYSFVGQVASDDSMESEKIIALLTK